ncbi:hypothetical protein AVEN_187902-1 [Araneus ventricosus]|uniref:Uncharacterized protein n=1 Tax=Araneus ventricosus TaxID=182803 RepID=A0A4Y2CUJ8_ARAVE|nr:hypothetical protein AVEN_187902-1 [Araneus ventricosus]
MLNASPDLVVYLAHFQLHLDSVYIRIIAGYRNSLMVDGVLVPSKGAGSHMSLRAGEIWMAAFYPFPGVGMCPRRQIVGWARAATAPSHKRGLKIPLSG